MIRFLPILCGWVLGGLALRSAGVDGWDSALFLLALLIVDVFSHARGYHIGKRVGAKRVKQLDLSRRLFDK